MTFEPSDIDKVVTVTVYADSDPTEPVLSTTGRLAAYGGSPSIIGFQFHGQKDPSHVDLGQFLAVVERFGN